MRFVAWFVAGVAVGWMLLLLFVWILGPLFPMPWFD